MSTPNNPLPNTREWTTSDGNNDRSIPERPVSQNHHDRHGHQTVDAVPSLWYRPGRRN